jgi:hypothetical protein
MRSCRAASLQRRAAYSIQQDETDELMSFRFSLTDVLRVDPLRLWIALRVFPATNGLPAATELLPDLFRGLSPSTTS